MQDFVHQQYDEPQLTPQSWPRVVLKEYFFNQKLLIFFQSTPKPSFLYVFCKDIPKRSSCSKGSIFQPQVGSPEVMTRVPREHLFCSDRIQRLMNDGFDREISDVFFGSEATCHIYIYQFMKSI